MEENMRQEEMMQVENLTPVEEPVRTEPIVSASEPYPYEEHALLLGVWLGRLFWLFIAAFVLNFIARSLEGPFAAIVLLAKGIAVGYVLLQLAAVHKGYRIAGWLSIVVAAVDVAASLLPAGRAVLSLVVLIPAMVASFVQMYFEYSTHAEVLQGLDEELSHKWQQLWKWTIGLLAGLIGCILLAIAAPLSGAMMALLVALALVVTVILYVVYIRRMAQMFQNYAEREMTAHETTL